DSIIYKINFDTNNEVNIYKIGRNKLIVQSVAENIMDYAKPMQ
ncbi:15554_t:CDS:1, partial [Funneliformis geosporum]